MQTTNPIGQRRHNLAVLARAIWKNPGISRRELVDRFDIDESSVSRLVGQLLDSGLVESGGAIEGSTAPGPAPGGRRRVALNIRRDFGQVWGVALWRDRIRVSVTDIHGVLLASSQVSVESYSGDWRAYLLKALEEARVLGDQTAPGLPVLGVGFGVPGWIDSESSKVVQSDEFGLKDSLCPLEWPDHLPVLWENDANCGAWSDLGAGTPKGDEVFVLGRFLEHGPMGLPAEFATGFGLVMGGQLHRGWRHFAGEFRSALWHPGNSSAYGVDDLTYGRCRTDREAFLAVLQDLLRNLRFMDRLLDPQAILLGGDLKDHHEDVLEAARRIGWEESSQLFRPLPVGTDEVSLGAALLVLDELFHLPKDNRRTFFRGYGTGVNDPLWRGLPLDEVMNGLS